MRQHVDTLPAYTRYLSTREAAAECVVHWIRTRGTPPYRGRGNHHLRFLLELAEPALPGTICAARSG
jgi:hypothetical protein